MKKNNFIEGALIATFGIIFVKIIGLLYVVPFYALIGEKGGALYGYAYNIYQLFLGISSAGFPFAIAKITSEYSALGYNKAVKKTYKLATSVIFVLSLIIFIFLFIFAPQIGKLIIGDATGGNTYNDIAFVVRMVSFSILVVPFLSVTKGYLQGHKYIAPGTTSQVIEQIARVAVILVGTFLALKVFNLGLTNAVGIAVFGSFIGGLCAYLYLHKKVKKVKENESVVNEENISSKQIIKKILSYSVPFILINLAYELYTSVDMILVIRTLTDILHYETSKVESIISIYTTWGQKLNMIILAISTGVVTSLIPNIVSSFAVNKMDEVNNKFNKALQCVLIVVVPITLFLSLLSQPVWSLFYGNSYYGPIVYRVFVYTALFGGVYTIIMNTLQGLSKYKLVLTSVLIGLLTNTAFDIPLMLLCNYLHTEPYYGASISTAIGYSLSAFISLYVLKKKYGFSFHKTKTKIWSFLMSWVIFIITIQILKIFIPTNIDGRLIQIPILAIYGLVSFGIYGIINYLNGNLQEIFSIKLKKKKDK
jgi:O-antigen/teichoic acid export membrane protein